MPCQPTTPQTVTNPSAATSTLSVVFHEMLASHMELRLGHSTCGHLLRVHNVRCAGKSARGAGCAATNTTQRCSDHKEPLCCETTRQPTTNIHTVPTHWGWSGHTTLQERESGSLESTCHTYQQQQRQQRQVRTCTACMHHTLVLYALMNIINKMFTSCGPAPWGGHRRLPSQP